MEKDNFIIEYDKQKEFICVKNPLSSDEIDKLYKYKYYKAKGSINKRLGDEEWNRNFYLDRYLSFEEYLSNNRREILDIGCGIGSFLEVGKERGWNCIGVEPSIQASQVALEKKLTIINDNFKKELFDKKFDVIYLNHVLEHINEPLNMISDIRELLSDDGIVFIGVPNDFSSFQEILWKNLSFDPWWIVPEHHINYFSFQSLSNILEKNGFEILLKETTFPMELFLLMGDDYISNPSEGDNAHLKRVNFDMSLSKYNNNLKRKLYQSLANLGIGRDIIIYARKTI